MFSHITKDFIGNKQSLSVGLAFVSMGLLFGNWASFIPFVKYKFNLDDAQLGLVLLGLPLGTLAMNPLAAHFIRKYGMKSTTIFGWLSLMICFGLLLNAPFLWLLVFFLFLCGASIATTNVGMNTCVNALEHQQKIRIMSTSHGMFSIGLMLGSMTGSLIGGIGFEPGLYMVFVSLFLFLAWIYAKPKINLIHEEKSTNKQVSKKIIIPTGSFLLMIIISLCINITEGTMADWTAVYMREVVNSGKYFEGWGLASYSLFMATGRLLGDNIIPRIGSNKVLVYGGVLSIIGLMIVIFFPFTFSSILGFALVGAGVSCGAPILYASASRLPGMAKGSGLAAMNTFAMGGFLFGPVIIGFISKAFSLTIAFGFIALLGLVWVFNSKRVKLF